MTRRHDTFIRCRDLNLPWRRVVTRRHTAKSPGTADRRSSSSWSTSLPRAPVCLTQQAHHFIDDARPYTARCQFQRRTTFTRCVRLSQRHPYPVKLRRAEAPTSVNFAVRPSAVRAPSSLDFVTAMRTSTSVDSYINTPSIPRGSIPDIPISALFCKKMS